MNGDSSTRRNKCRTGCCVPHCNKPGYVTGDDGREVTFHKLPIRNKDRLREWIVKIRRDTGPSFNVTAHTRICSRHFDEKDFRITFRGKKYLKDTATPKIFQWTKAVKTRTVRSTESVPMSEEAHVDVDGPAEDLAMQVDTSEINLQLLNKRIKLLENNLLREKERGDLLERERNHVRQMLTAQRTEKQPSTFSIETFKDSNSDVCFYTGFPTYNTLTACYRLLDPENNILMRNTKGKKTKLKDTKLSFPNQFFLTLVRLRLGLLERDLAHRFHISQTAVHRYFISWINYIYLRLGSRNIWPSQEQIQRTMPATMKEKFPNLEWIIDAFEIQTQRPSSLMLQSQSYSSYKSRNTVKGLVACTPSGQVGFISQLYTGNISDRELVMRSGFLDMTHNRGAMWLVDKGFQIQDLADPLGVVVNMPAFVGSKGKLTAQEVFHTQSVASERIHIERAINKIKRFHFFDRPIPISTLGSVNQAWTVCGLLTLFQNPIISA